MGIGMIFIGLVVIVVGGIAGLLIWSSHMEEVAGENMVDATLKLIEALKSSLRELRRDRHQPQESLEAVLFEYHNAVSQCDIYSGFRGARAWLFKRRESLVHELLGLLHQTIEQSRSNKELERPELEVTSPNLELYEKLATELLVWSRSIVDTSDRTIGEIEHLVGKLRRLKLQCKVFERINA